MFVPKSVGFINSYVYNNFNNCCSKLKPLQHFLQLLHHKNSQSQVSKQWQTNKIIEKRFHVSTTRYQVVSIRSQEKGNNRCYSNSQHFAQKDPCDRESFLYTGQQTTLAWAQCHVPVGKKDSHVPVGKTDSVVCL
jgi:hypothetical protein